MMKRFFLFTMIFLFAGGLFSAYAMDFIILRNGLVIEGEVVEVTRTEVRYKHIDFLEGPAIPISRANVLSIRYADGSVEVLTKTPLPEAKQEKPKAKADESVSSINTLTTAMNPDKLIFGISIEPLGLFSPDLFPGFGPSLSAEVTKGAVNAKISFSFPAVTVYSYYDAGLGVGLSLNYFWHSRIGGGYLGGIADYVTTDFANSIWGIAINAGYKFVFRSGLYFRVGASGGCFFQDAAVVPAFKQDLAIGYNL